MKYSKWILKGKSRYKLARHVLERKKKNVMEQF